MRLHGLSIARWAAAASVVVLSMFPTPVLADTAGPDSSSSGGSDCAVEDECPDSGVSCYDDACASDAEDKGLELRCEAGSKQVYCDPEESSGCATAGPPGKGTVHVALATFLVATALTVARAHRRGRRR